MPYAFWLLLCLILPVCGSLMADVLNKNPYSPWMVREITDSNEVPMSAGFTLCPKLSPASYESCTVWEMFHENDTDKDYPFYFSRIDDFGNTIAEDCVTKKVIKEKMIATTNRAFGISKNNKNGVLFDSAHRRYECLVAATCTNLIGTCEKGTVFSIQAAYSGFLPAGFGGCDEIINAVKPVMKTCETNSSVEAVKKVVIAVAIVATVIVLVAGGVCAYSKRLFPCQR